MPRTRYNPAQGVFEGFDDTPEPTDNLFFALQPDAETAERIAALTRALQAQHKLTGRPIAAERLHVSLFHIGAFLGVPRGHVADACAAAAALKVSGFRIAFDAVGSYAGRVGDHPLVLRGAEREDGASGVVAVKAFRHALRDAMLRAGIGHGMKGEFTPHVTLMYDGRRLAEQAVDEIAWTVHDFVLVHGFVGRSQYELLGRWPLSA